MSILVGLTLLSACQATSLGNSNITSPEPLPSNEELTAFAYAKYHAVNKRPPEKVIIHSAKIIDLDFLASDPDAVVCVTTEEKSESDSYTQTKPLKTPDGTIYGYGMEISKPAGSPFRQTWAMTLRYYLDQGEWKSLFFRRYGNEIFGQEISRHCEKNYD